MHYDVLCIMTLCIVRISSVLINLWCSEWMVVAVLTDHHVAGSRQVVEVAFDANHYLQKYMGNGCRYAGLYRRYISSHFWDQMRSEVEDHCQNANTLKTNIDEVLMCPDTTTPSMMMLKARTIQPSMWATGSTPILEQLLNRLRLSGHSLIRRPVQLHAIACLSICYW